MAGIGRGNGKSYNPPMVIFATSVLRSPVAKSANILGLSFHLWSVRISFDERHLHKIVDAQRADECSGEDEHCVAERQRLEFGQTVYPDKHPRTCFGSKRYRQQQTRLRDPAGALAFPELRSRLFARVVLVNQR